MSPLPYDSHDLDVDVRTAGGEARDEGDDGLIATLWTIRNRLEIGTCRGASNWWGDAIAQVCLKAAQFSCWNPGDPNRGECRLGIGSPHRAASGRPKARSSRCKTPPSGRRVAAETGPPSASPECARDVRI
jgi:Cell Wall Hydrolase